jgi:hypothetical protein
MKETPPPMASSGRGAAAPSCPHLVGATALLVSGHSCAIEQQPDGRQL